MNDPRTYFGFLIENEDGSIELNEDEETWNYDNEEECSCEDEEE